MSQQEIDKKPSWKKILQEIQLETDPSTYKSVFSRTTLEQTPKGEWEIQCPNDGVRFLIETKYKKLLITKLQQHSGGAISVVRITTKEGNTEKQKEPIGPLFPDPSETFAARLSKSSLNPQLTFDTFAVSVSNQIAHAAAQAAAQQPGEVYSPLFLWGGVGVGKTHLMHAVGNRILKDTDLRVMYCSAEEFTNALVDAIRSRSSGIFRKRFRSVDVLLIDDIQFVSQRDFVQEELFNTFNALYTQKKQIVFTSDKPPRALQHIEERLASRFLSGLVVDIGRPDFELKTAILLIKARQKHLILDIDGAKVIAGGIEDIREIEGFLLKLRALYGENATISAEDLRRHLIQEPGTHRNGTSPKEIIRVVSQELDIPLKEIKGESRKKNIATARHICMYFLKNYTQLTYEDIAALLGKKDHTTVMHGVQKIIDEIGTNDATRRSIEKIRLYFS